MKLSLLLRWSTLLFCSTASYSSAATWYLRADQPQGKSWTTLTDWWSTRTGTGTNPTTISSADTFDTNGYSLRTPETTGGSTFPGGTLIVSKDLSIKNKTVTAATVVGNLQAIGGPSRKIVNSATGVQIVNIASLSTTDSEVTIFDTGGTTKGLNVTIQTLKGNGDVRLAGGGTISFRLTNASEFYGRLIIGGNSPVTFDAAFTSSGAMVIETGSKVTLNQSLGFTGLSIAGVEQSSNTTWTSAQLISSYPAIFPSGTGSLNITQRVVVIDASKVVNNVGVGQLGVNLGAGNFYKSDMPYRQDLRALRVGMVRTPTYPDKGYSLEGMDVRVAQILNTGGIPFFIQQIRKPAPPWSTEDAAFHAKLLDLNGNPGGTFATNLTYLVKRYMAPPYNQTIQYWEFGNEPDISIDYMVPNAQEYITLYQEAHKQLIASGVRQNVKLCGPVVSFEYGFDASFGKADDIFEAFFAACGTPLNGYNQVDILTRHVYADIYDWETGTPKTTLSEYNLLNAPCEQVTFTQSLVPGFGGRGEGAIQMAMRRNGFPDSTGTGITEMNVPDIYLHTITQGLWFLTFDHFALYNPRNAVSSGFVFDTLSNRFSYYKNGPSYSWWATYVHGILTGDQILAQNSSDPHLLVTGSKDPSYVYLQVLNRNTAALTASVKVNNAPIQSGLTIHQLTSTLRPDAPATSSYGSAFSYTFPAMSSTIFRYKRTDAPTPPQPPAPPTTVLLDTDFSAAPAGMQTYYVAYQPNVTTGDLYVTGRVANSRGAAIFNGQPLPSSATQVQVRFGLFIDSHSGDGIVFGAYRANPGAVGGATSGMGYYGQTNQIWGVKLDNQPDEFGVITGANVSPSVEGWSTQKLAEYYNKELYIVIDYDGAAQSVRARLYQGTSESGILLGDIMNLLGNPASLPAGTVFGFTGATNSFYQNSRIHDLKILWGNSTTTPPSTGLPAPWASQSIGTAGGSASYSNSTFTINGSGNELMSGTADAFYYAFQQASGDCTITARVASLSPTPDPIKGETGVMIRESLTAGSLYSMLGITTARGYQFHARATAGTGPTVTSGGSGVAPGWVRLVRTGNTFTAYKSVDGINWGTAVGTATIPMASNVYIGLPIAHHGGIGTATLDNVTVSP